MPRVGTSLQTPHVIVPTHKSNWPVKEAAHSSFEKALMGEAGPTDEAEPDLLDEDLPITEREQLGEDADEAGDAWDMGDDAGIENGDDSDFVNIDNPDAPVDASGPGSSEAELWSRHSPLAADHVAGGSFESAMQLLNRQVGAVNFAPLKPRFLEIYQASKTYLSANPSLPPIINYIRRNVDETESRKALPIIPRDLETLSTADLQSGYTAMRSNKLEDGVRIFKDILQSLIVNVVTSQSQVDDAKALITKSVDYALAMSIELARRSISTTEGEDGLKRQLELSAYFTVPKLDVSHRQLALMAAMKLSVQNKQYSSALSFANRVIANGGASKMVDQVSFTLVKMTVLIHDRQREPNNNLKEPDQPIKSTLNMINSLISIFVQLHSHQFTVEVKV